MALRVRNKWLHHLQKTINVKTLNAQDIIIYGSSLQEHLLKI